MTCILVTGGIPADTVRKLNLEHAPDPRAALARAFQLTGESARIAVLERASETLPLIQKKV